MLSSTFFNETSHLSNSTFLEPSFGGFCLTELGCNESSSSGDDYSVNSNDPMSEIPPRVRVPGRRQTWWDSQSRSNLKLGISEIRGVGTR